MGSYNEDRKRNVAAYILDMQNRLSQVERNRTRTTGLAANAVSATNLTGEVVLSDNTIRSANYVEGYSGWSIDGDGNSEFANVFVRGNINANSGTIGNWTISNEIVTRRFNKKVATITAVTWSDGVIKFTAANTFNAGEYVTISGIDPDDYNFYDIEIDSATSTYFTVLSDAAADYVSGGTAELVYAGTYVENLDIGLDDETTSSGSYVGLYTSPNLRTAGLYLRDYSKREFDYGYFSNAGVSYVSAEDINLLENPTFEYKDSLNAINYSAASWTAGTGLTLLAGGKDFTAGTPLYAASPKYGAQVTWTTAVSTYFTGKLHYTAGKSYAVFKNRRNLYLGLKVFPLYTPVEKTVTAVEGVRVSGTVTGATSTATTVTYTGTSLQFELGQRLTVTGFGNARCNVSNAIVSAKSGTTSVTVLSNGDSGITSTASTADNAVTGLLKITAASHGFTAGQVVFLDFDAGYLEPEFGEVVNMYSPHTIANGTSGYTFVVSTFGLAAGSFHVPADFSDIEVSAMSVIPHGSRATKAFSVYEAAFDLSSIRLRYDNGSTTNLSSVLAATTAAEWSAGTNKYLISNANSYMLGRLDTAVKIPPMTQANEIVISGEKVEAAYLAADPTAYGLDKDIFIDLPGWLYPHDGNGVVSNTPTKIASIGYILDEVYFSSSNSFFYGSGGGSYRWYATTDTTPSYDPAQASVEGTKTWLNIDLGNQSASLDYFDYIKFKPQVFTKALKERPSIGVFDAVVPYIKTNDPAPEITTVSSGQYEYIIASDYRNVSSHLKTTTGERSSAFEISALYRDISASSGSETGRKGALVGGVYDGLSNSTTLYLSSDSLQWSSNYISPTNPNYAQVRFADKAYFNIPVRIASNMSLSGTFYGAGSIVTSSGNIRTTSGNVYTTSGNIYTTSGNIYSTSGNIYTTSGSITASTSLNGQTLRLSSTDNISLGSNTHAFQIGDSTSTNLRLDTNEVQAQGYTSPNRTTADLYLNKLGGDVFIGNTGTSNLTANGTITSGGIVYSGSNLYTNGITTTTSWFSNATDFTALVNGVIHSSNTGGEALRLSRKSSTGAVVNFYYGSATVAGHIDVTGTSSVSYITSSDYRLKENVVAIRDAASRLKNLNPVRFNFKDEPGRTVDGFLAHEVAAYVPEAISGEKDAVDEDGNPIYQGIDQSKMVPLLTAALQEAIARIEVLEGRA